MKKKLLILLFVLLGMKGFAQADIVVTNTDYSNTYTAGQYNTYQITVVNLGPQVATNVHVTNAIPLGISNFSWVGSNNSSGYGILLDNTIPSLAVGAVVTYTITIKVPGSMTTPLVSQTVVTTSSVDPNPACTQCTDTDTKGIGADISVVNTDGQPSYTPGTNNVYTVTVTNNGPLTATNINVQNAIPAGITNFSWIGNASSGTNVPLNNIISSLGDGESVVYTITIQVPAAFTGNLVNQTTFTSSTTDPVPGCTQCTDTDVPHADIVVTNTDGAATYTPGTTHIYTLTVHNNGPVAAANVHVVNAIPAGITNFSWSGDNGSSGTNVNLDDTIASMANGATVVYTITVQIPLTQTGDLTSETLVTSATLDINPNCPGCTDVDTLVPIPVLADIVVVNTDNQANYVPSGTNVYTITVTNNGPDAAQNVHVTNAIPAGITNFSWTGSNGSSGTNVALDDTILTLANGQTVTYTVTLAVPAGYSGSLTSQTVVTSATTDPVPACAACIDVDTLGAGADVVVVNTDGTASYLPGTTHVYTVTVHNNGPAIATNVHVTNAIPAGITLFSWTGDNASSGTNVPLDNTIPTLAVGATVTYTVTVQIPAAFAGNLTSQTVVTTTSTDPVPGCAQCIDIDTIDSADIVVVNTDGQTTYVPGHSATYTVTVTNNGPGAATNVHVTNAIPAGITAFSWTGDNGSNGSNVPLDNTIATLAVGQTVTYTITVLVPVGFSGNLTSQTVVTSATVDPVPACAACIDVDTPFAGADLVVTKSDGTTTFTPGANSVYTITILNNGPAAAANVAVQDLVPAGIPAANVTWTSASGAGTGNLNDLIPVINAGSTVTYQVTVAVPSNYSQSTDLVNTVTVTSPTPDPFPTCPNCTDTDTPAPSANLITVKTDNQPSYLNDSDVIYNIVIANSGPSDALNVNVGDALPANVTVMNWTGTNGTSGTGALSDVIPLLAVGQTASYQVTIHVPDNYNTTTVNLVNTVVVTSDTPDPVPVCAGCTDIDTPRPKFVTVDITKYTIPQLVEDILIDSDCANVSNFTSQVGAGANIGVGYFHRNNSNFPLKSGAVIRCGRAKACEGPFTDANTSTVGSGASDNASIGYPSPDGQDLHGVSIANGNGGTIQDVSYIQFDFLPLTDNFSFDFLFASNEYGTFQCTFGDVFAFILKDQVTGTLTNLAVIPATTTPVSVTSIRNTLYNNGCGSVNPGYFDVFNQGSPANAAIDMRGQTVKMTASAIVIPNHQYSIKLVIGDYNDMQYDSAVFIEAGSFNVGQADLGNDMLVSAGTAGCAGSSMVLDTQLDPATYTFVWTKDGVVIPGEVLPTLTVTEPGEYGVTASNGSCAQTDSIVVEFRDPVIPPAQAPTGLTECTNVFNLTDIQPDMFGTLNPANYDIGYYHTQFNAENEISPIGTATNYTGTDGEVVYVKVLETNSGYDCYVVFPFTLHIDAPDITNPSPDQSLCLGANPDPFSVTTTYTATDSVSYVYFNTQQTGNNMYTGGTLLDTATPVAGTATYDAPILGNPGSLPNVVGTYYVYAIANPTPVTVCKPFKEIKVTVVGLPTATISGNATICSGGTSTITFNGTPNATVTYTVDTSGNQTIVLDATGTASLTTPALTANSVYSLVSVQVGGPTGCSQNLSGSATVTISALPTATISGDTTICSGTTAVITFNGTANATVTYHVDSNPNQTIILNGSGTNTITTPSLTTTSVYTLVSIQDASALACSQNISGTATVTVSGLPTASISGTATICSGNTAVITFTGTSNATVTYHVDSNPNQTIVLNAAGTATLTTPALTADSVYTLVGVNLPTCSNTASGSATITVAPLPTATISGNATICSGTTAVITFNGTPNATVTYHVDSNPDQTIVLNGAGTNTLTTPSLTTSSVYTLVSVQAAGPLACTQNQAGTATVTVLPLPTAAISGTATVCQNAAAPAITFTGTGGTAPYTFTYNINNTGNVTVTTTVGNSVTVNAPTATPGIFNYNLVSVQSSGTPACGQPYDGVATITVSPLPTAVISGTVGTCQNNPEPVVTFTGSNGTPPYTFTYNINTGGNLTVVSTGNTATVTAPTSATGIFDYHLISVHDSSPMACSQNQSGTATIIVVGTPVITAPSDLNACDDNNDGFSCLFDLPGTIPSITGGNAGLVVTFHETLTDAQTGANPINTSSLYCNIVANDQTIYARVYDPAAPSCASTTSFMLHVHRVPVANAVITDYELCDVNNPGDGVEVFNLPIKNLEILNGQTGVNVTFYESQAAAQAGSPAIANISTYTNTGSPEVIWVRLQDAVTGCFGVGSFRLVVNPLPLVFPKVMNACGTSSGIAEFNLTTQDLEVSGGVLGMAVTYYETQAAAQAGSPQIATPAAYTNTTPNMQIVYARVENTITHCFSITTVTLTVTTGPAANTPAALQVCDPNNDCFAGFDLTDAINDIFGGPVPAGVSVTFHETMTDAQTGATFIANPSNYTNIVCRDQDIYVAVTYDATGCRSVVVLHLHVNDTPQGVEIDPLQVCDDDTDGIGTFDLNAAIPSILGSLDAAQNTVTFYETQAAAQAGTPVITNVLGYHNTTPGAQSIWVRVEDNTTHCFDVLSIDLIVSPKPSLPPTPTGAAVPMTKCDDNNPGDEQEVFDLTSAIPGILNGQLGVSVTFYETQAAAQAGTPQVNGPTAYTNTPNAQTLWVRMENDATHCFVLTTMDLRVEPLPVLIPPDGPIVECDPDGDGFAIFDLDALVVPMLQGVSGITVTFHETMTDAQNGNNAIVGSNAYLNNVPFVQPLYVRAKNDVTGCVSVMMIELNVIASPTVPPLEDLSKCDEDANNQDGHTNFNLTLQDAVILAAQSGPASDYLVSYYLTQADAQAGVSPIIPASNFINSTNPQTIWVRITAKNTECFNVGSFQVKVSTPLALTTPTQLSICDDGPTSAVPTAEFDLTVKEAELMGGTIVSGYTVAYYLTQGDAQGGINPISDPAHYTNIANAQTLFVVVTGPGPSFCRSFTTLTIRVLPLPVPKTDPLPLEACDDDTDGIAIFDLTQNEDYIRDNDPQLAFAYFATLADAQAGTPAIVPATAYPTASGTIYIRVERNTEPNYLGDFCYTIVEQQVIVNPLPVVQDADLKACDPAAASTYNFDLHDADGLVLGAGQDVADFTFDYYHNLADAQGGVNQITNDTSYPNTTNPETVVVRVTNKDTGCMSYATVTLKVLAGATAANVVAAAVCDTDTDGVMPVTLTDFDAQVLGAQDPAVFTVAYFASQGDALAGTSALASPYDTASGVLYAVVTNTATDCRSTPATVTLSIEPLVDITIHSDTPDGISNTICVDFNTGALLSGLTLLSGLPDDGTYTFQWTLGGSDIAGATGATYTITDPAGFGTYTVVATSALGCVSTSHDFVVLQSGPAVVATGTNGYAVSHYFEDHQTITISVTGYGTYQYQLDEGPLQDSNVFDDVPPGVHTVHVYDVEGDGTQHCDVFVISGIQTVNYPHFFTPNGDGINDTWFITGLDSSAKIYIFDRYGKLIKQISPVNTTGWDGTYNGQPLPSTDYWFTVYYSETGTNREFRAHFSLKR